MLDVKKIVGIQVFIQAIWIILAELYSFDHHFVFIYLLIFIIISLPSGILIGPLVFFAANNFIGNNSFLKLVVFAVVFLSLNMYLNYRVLSTLKEKLFKNKIC